MSIRKYIFPVAVALLSLSACGSEDALTPSNADVNGFAPAASDNSATAQLRNAFYKETGSYLLFNDTLNATDTQGNPELFDASYAMTGTGSVDSYNYKYSYITDVTEQQKFAEDVKTYLLNKLGKANPSLSCSSTTSVMSTVMVGQSMSTTYLLPVAMCSARTTALCTTIRRAISPACSPTSSSISSADCQATVTDPFYAYSKTLYGEYLSDHDIDATVGERRVAVWLLGEIRRYLGWYRL
jgi:hypothetical protein